MTHGPVHAEHDRCKLHGVEITPNLATPSCFPEEAWELERSADTEPDT